MRVLRTIRPLLALVVMLVLLLTACSGPETAPGASGTDTVFPACAPEDVGLSTRALEALSDVVAGYVEEDRIVGAELLIIQDRHTVLHRAYGMLDRDLEVPMTTDTLFNLRSMTKPLTGVAIHLLIEEGRLALDDRVADRLATFNRPSTGAVTVEDLLTHRSGLPLSILFGVDEYDSLLEMATAAAEAGPDFHPGSRFAYSDAGIDVLGALIESVTGESLHTFVTERILDPLAMDDTFYYITATADDPRAERIAPLYVTQGGGWTRFWTPEEPLYPFAWGSQTLYGTPSDYARFLAMWLDNGAWMGETILSEDRVEQMMEPVSVMTGLGTTDPFPTGFLGLTAAYGQTVTLHVPEQEIDGSPVVIGHSGSDGTIGWAWPEHDLIILFFTQSRGSGAPIDLEAEIDRLLLHPEIEEANAAARREYAALLGSYIPQDGPAPDRATIVTVRNGTLALAVPGEITYELVAQEGSPAWRFELYPETGLTFRLSDSGTAEGFAIHQMGSRTEFVRGEPRVTAPLTEDAVSDLLGIYLDKEADRRLTVRLQDGELVIDQPETPIPLELHRPDADGWWALRLNPQVRIRFETDPDGSVTSFTVRSPEGEAIRHRVVEEPKAGLAPDEISFSHDDLVLTGTLSTPAGDEPHPAVILISGSGSQDRHGETPAIPGYRPFEWIAEALVGQGVAVLRFDDRGVGGSGGAPATATSAETALDVEAALAFLRTKPEIDADRIGLVGHSEGGLVAAMVASRDPGVSFIVSLAGPAANGLRTLEAQMRRSLQASGASPEEIAEAAEEQQSIYRLALDQDWDALDDRLIEVYRRKLLALSPEAQAELGDLEAAAQQRAEASAANLRSPILQFFLNHDPSEDWQRVSVPILAVFGGLDTQADAALNHTELEAAVARSGNEALTIHVLERANHLFQEAVTGSIAEYNDLPRAFVPEFLPIVSEWVVEQTQPPER